MKIHVTFPAAGVSDAFIPKIVTPLVGELKKHSHAQVFHRTIELLDNDDFYEVQGPERDLLREADLVVWVAHVLTGRCKAEMQFRLQLGKAVIIAVSRSSEFEEAKTLYRFLSEINFPVEYNRDFIFLSHYVGYQEIVERVLVWRPPQPRLNNNSWVVPTRLGA